jgi:hypothetical protein
MRWSASNSIRNYPADPLPTFVSGRRSPQTDASAGLRRNVLPPRNLIGRESHVRRPRQTVEYHLLRRPSPRFPPPCAGVVMVIATLFLAGCGGPISPDGPKPVELLDTNVTLVEGVNCNVGYVGYVGAEFTGVAGRTVAISMDGAGSLTPHFILYAPDFATQLAVSSSRSPGRASLMFALTQSGLHHLSICDVNGVAGTLRVIVFQL